MEVDVILMLHDTFAENKCSTLATEASHSVTRTGARYKITSSGPHVVASRWMTRQDAR
jgi:hypothetical protein